MLPSLMHTHLSFFSMYCHDSRCPPGLLSCYILHITIFQVLASSHLLLPPLPPTPPLPFLLSSSFPQLFSSPLPPLPASIGPLFPSCSPPSSSFSCSNFPFPSSNEIPTCLYRPMYIIVSHLLLLSYELICKILEEAQNMQSTQLSV